MLTPDDLLTVARDELAERRAQAAATALRRDGTIHAGRSEAIRALGRALVAAGTRLEGRSPVPALVPPARHDPCEDEASVPKAA